jgi:hypothetical protein
MSRRVAFATGLCVLFFSIATSTSSATTATVGQLFTPGINCVGPFTYLQTASPSGGTSYVIPFDGVITSWAWHAGATPVTGLKLKVGHAVGGGQFVIDAEAPAGSQTPNAATSYPAKIPVQAGEIIGITQNGGSCASEDVGYAITFWTGDVPPSSNPVTPTATNSDRALPVQATVTQTPAGQQAFRFGKLKRNTRNGTAILAVIVPGPGTLALSGRGIVRQRGTAASRATGALSKAVSAAGAVKLKIRPKGKKKRKLSSTGAVRVKAKATYTPTGGVPNSKTKLITLIKRRR